MNIKRLNMINDPIIIYDIIDPPSNCMKKTINNNKFTNAKTRYTVLIFYYPYFIKGIVNGALYTSADAYLIAAIILYTKYKRLITIINNAPNTIHAINKTV